MNLPELLPLASPNDLHAPRHFHTNGKLRSAICSFSSWPKGANDPFLVNITLTEHHGQILVLRKATKLVKRISEARELQNMLPKEVST